MYKTNMFTKIKERNLSIFMKKFLILIIVKILP